MSTTGNATGLSFGGLLRSEWIKLWSLRSTYWCFGIAVALTIGFGFLVATADSDLAERAPGTAALVQAATGGISVSELVVAVLGALVITGEYGTGMIRTTFLAAPRRLDALGVKALTYAIVVLVIGILSVAVSTAIAAAVFAAGGHAVDAGTAAFWFALLGAAGALALVGLMAVGIGTLVRNSAFAITLSVGILFVLPIILSIVSGLTRSAWLAKALQYLPSEAASTMSSYDPSGAAHLLDPWQAALVLAAWAALFLGLGLLVARRRDA